MRPQGLRLLVLGVACGAPAEGSHAPVAPDGHPGASVHALAEDLGVSKVTVGRHELGGVPDLRRLRRGGAALDAVPGG